MSTDNPSLLRVMAHTLVVCQAAGVAPRQVDIGAVQSELRRQAVPI